MPVRHHIPFSWIAPISMALLLVLLGACTAEPITSIADFDFRFEEIDDVEIVVETDTTDIAVVFTPVEEDTSYVEKQDNFLQSATGSQGSGQVSQQVTEVAEAAEQAFPAETQAQLDTLAEQASADPAAFAEQLDLALEDTTSSTFDFTTQLENLAAQQQVLADLLGLVQPSGKSRALRRSPPAEYGPAFDLYGKSSGVQGCREDAELQHARKVASLDSTKAKLESSAQRAFDRGVAAADSFRTHNVDSLRRHREGRKARAVEYFIQVNAAIDALLTDGLIPASSARQLRQVNMTVLLTRLKRQRQHFRESVAAVEAAADEALKNAQERLEKTRRDVVLAHETALRKAQEVLQTALRTCHDQGGSSG